MFSKNYTNIFIFSFYISLLIGSYYGENLIGGAKSDYHSLFYLTEKFRENFFFTLINYDELGHRHSPIFYMFRALISENENIQKIFFLHLFLLIPLFFYKCLKLVFHEKKEFLKIISLLLFILPTFRSYSIWPDAHLFGTLFFIISLYYFLKFKLNNSQFKFSAYNIIFLSLSAYASPNFGVFIIYFFYEYLKKYRFNHNLIYIILLNIFLSLPFFYYTFFLDVNFLFNDNWGMGKNFYSLTNVANKIIILSSIFLFFLLPFLDFRKIIDDFQNHMSPKFYLISIMILFLSVYFFDFSETYNLTNSGGGIFYNISNFFFDNNYFLYFSCLVSFYLITKIIFYEPKNIILFFCLILSNPQLTIWQSNHSPTILFLILLIFKINFIYSKFSIKNCLFIYSYFIVYALSYVLKNLII